MGFPSLSTNPVGAASLNADIKCSIFIYNPSIGILFILQIHKSELRSLAVSLTLTAFYFEEV